MQWNRIQNSLKFRSALGLSAYLRLPFLNVFMLFFIRHNVHDLQLTLQVNSVKFLGLHFDNWLKWKTHINELLRCNLELILRGLYVFFFFF